MNCRTARKIIPLAAGGDADGAEEASLREHVSSCRECARLLEEMKRQTAMLRTAFAAPAPARFAGAADRALAAAAAPQPPAHAERPYWKRMEFLLPASAAAAVLILAAAHLADMAIRPAGQPGGGSPVFVRHAPKTPARSAVLPVEAGVVMDSPSGGGGGFPIAEIGGSGDAVQVIANLSEESAADGLAGGRSLFMLGEIEQIEDATVSIDF